MSRRGQALLEFAICLPLLVALALGSSALIRLADARAGLDAATAAAVAAAARAPDPESGARRGAARFGAVAAAYPLAEPRLRIDTGDWARGSRVTASGAAGVDLGFAPVPGLPREVRLSAVSEARIQAWRGR